MYKEILIWICSKCWVDPDRRGIELERLLFPSFQLDPSAVDRTWRGSDTVLADIWRLSIEGTRLFNSISESSLSHELGVVRGKHGWPRFTARHSGMSTANTRLRTLGNVLPTSALPHERSSWGEHRADPRDTGSLSARAFGRISLISASGDAFDN